MDNTDNVSKAMKKIAVIIHECHPEMGSEAHSGWNYLNGLSRYALNKGITVDVYIAETNIMHTVSYKEAISNHTIPNINLFFIPHSKFLSKRIAKQQKHYGGVGSFGLYYLKYYLWLRKVANKLHGYSTIHYYNHLIGFFLTKKLFRSNTRLILGPISGISEIHNDYTSSRESIRRTVQAFLIFRYRLLFKGKVHSVYYVGDQDKLFADKVCSYSKRVPEQALLVENLKSLQPKESDTYSDLKLVWIGELVPRKNIEILLEALKDIKTVKLIVIGDGPQKTYLIKKYSNLIESGIVKFTGRIPREEVFTKLENSDVLVHTSYREGTATTLVEGISTGNFIVAMDVGGHSCLINDTTGILLRLTSRNELIDSLKETLVLVEKNRTLLKKKKTTWTWEETLQELTKNYV
jgi:glycosyltransferase involved in cell wall biosynthesis